MRKFIDILAIAALLAALASCQKEQLTETSSGLVSRFSAEIEKVSKASSSMSDGKVAFETDDEILVSNGSETAVFKYVGGGFVTETPIAQADSYTAIYPASICSGIAADGTASISLPSVQTYAGDVVLDAPMSAVSSGSTLLFHNICTILKIEESGSQQISSVVFTAVNKGVAGAATVKDNVLTMASDESKSVTLDIESLTLSDNTPMYLYVPAQTYTGGFGIVTNFKNGGNVEKSTTKDNTLTPGMIKSTGVFDAVLFSGGEGTADNPYLIANEADLRLLSALSNGADAAIFCAKNYKQTADITMSSDNFRPIGENGSVHFSGTYNGQSKNIHSIQINNTVNNRAGLFGIVNGGEIKNIRINKANSKAINISSVSNVGAIAAQLKAGTISGCNIAGGSITADNATCGAVVGYQQGGVVSDCTVGSSITLTAQYKAGGISGVMEGSARVESCSVRGMDIVGTKNYCGGIAGYMTDNAVISSCASSAIIKVGASAQQTNAAQSGGIVGYMLQSAKTAELLVVNCYYGVDKDGKGGTITANTSGNTDLGGIIGCMNSSSDGTGTCSVVNCVGSPKLLANKYNRLTRTGGVVGNVAVKTASVINCYSTVSYNNFSAGGKILNATTTGNYANVSSACGVVGKNETLVKGVYGRPGWQILNNAGGTPLVDLSDAVGDPSMKNYAGVVYKTGTGLSVSGEASYATMKAALDAGAAAYNAGSPQVEAATWEVYPGDGYLRPSGVGEKATKTYKKVSLIGDSISTYSGFVYSTNEEKFSCHYPIGTPDAATDVLTVEGTWWYKLIYGKMTDARLEVDNSYSGSTVSYIDESHQIEGHPATTASKERSFYRRYVNNKFKLGNPDIIIFYGGRNDFGALGGNSDHFVGDYSASGIQTAYDKVAAGGPNYREYTNATVSLIYKMHVDYPKAKILMILHDMTSDAYEDADSAICAFYENLGYDIKFVNLHKRGTTNETNTEIGITKEISGGCHPNAEGSTAVANYIFSQVGSWLNE